jgi:hypothetical protein
VNGGSDATPLQAFVAAELAVAVSDPVRVFAEHLAQEDDALAVLFYGSVLRTGDLDGVLDFYVLTKGPRRRGWRGVLERRLWPEVSFRQLDQAGRTLQAKVAALPLAVFARAAAGETLDTTIWTRFVQPCALVLAADADARRAVEQAVAQACATAARFAAVLGPDRGTAEDFWAALFRGTYRAELRVEPPGREREIIGRNRDRFEALLPIAWTAAGVAFTQGTDELVPQLPAPEAARLHRAWRLRAALGKPLNLARLVKAPLTFQGAVRYAAWKIERHTSVAIAVTPWRERHPLLAAPGALWRIWRARRR